MITKQTPPYRNGPQRTCSFEPTRIGGHLFAAVLGPNETETPRGRRIVERFRVVER